MWSPQQERRRARAALVLSLAAIVTIAAAIGIASTPPAARSTRSDLADGRELHPATNAVAVSPAETFGLSEWAEWSGLQPSAAHVHTRRNP